MRTKTNARRGKLSTYSRPYASREAVIIVAAIVVWFAVLGATVRAVRMDADASRAAATARAAQAAELLEATQDAAAMLRAERDFAVAASVEQSITIATLQSDIASLTAECERLTERLRKEARAKVQQPSRSSAPTGWRTARVSWYGPGFYGRKTASGAVLTQGMMNVAHRSMPFGTRIEFRHKGRSCVAVVNDRGPFIGGREFDLGPGTATALGFGGVGTVEWRTVREGD